MNSENPFVPPAAEDSLAIPAGRHDGAVGGWAFLSKWFRIFLLCSIVASTVASIVTVFAYSRGDYMESLLDIRPRGLGRMLLDGPVTFGGIGAVVLALTSLIRRVL